MNIPDKRLDRFHAGQVWESNKGHLWRVEKIENGQAVMRKGKHGEGRVKRKPWDGVMTMVLFYDPEYSDVGIDYFFSLDTTRTTKLGDEVEVPEELTNE